MTDRRRLVLFSVLLTLLSGAFLLGAEHYRRPGAPMAPRLYRLLQRLEWNYSDAKFRLRPAEVPHGVLVARIDEPSLQKFGRWPWPRATFQQILEKLYGLGAEVVAFDAVFSEPEFNEKVLSSYFAARVQRQSLGEQLRLPPKIVGQIAAELPKVGDQVFGTALLEYPQTVLGYIWEERRGCNLGLPDAVIHEFRPGAAPQTDFERFELELVVQAKNRMIEGMGRLLGSGIPVPGLEPFSRLDRDRRLPGFLLKDCASANTPILARSSRHRGFFNAIPENDGIYRRLPLLLGFVSDVLPKLEREWLDRAWFERATFFPSLVLESLRSFYGAKGFEIGYRSEPGGRIAIEEVRIPRADASPLRIPVQPDGSLLLDFYPRGNRDANDSAFGSFSLADPEADLGDPAFQRSFQLESEKPLKNQIVLIGPTVLGVYDLRPNPMSADAAGVELHATALARILAFFQQEAESPGIRLSTLTFELGALVLAFLLVALAFVFLSPFPALLVTALVLAVFMGADMFVFLQFHIQNLAVTHLVLVFGLAASLFTYRYFTEERERSFVKGAFEKYVSPEIVKSILKDPKSLNLGGQRKVLSVLFSDVRDFTARSEGLSPTTLSRFMNEYLTAMTDIILEERGTVDKYVGDLIVAIFGAPVELPDHPTASVRAAIRMRRRLEELNVEWVARGIQPMRIGVGINTGEMSVGNMGSERIFSYTVLGDNVNLASRVEGLTKGLGADVLVTESTSEQLPADMLRREVGLFIVRGRRAPVRLFEVAWSEAAHSHPSDWKDSFESALRNFYSGNLEAAREEFDALAASGDEVARAYSQRCELGLAARRAGAEWAVAWTLTDK